MRRWIGKLISRPARFSAEQPAGRAAARGNLLPPFMTGAKARPPQPRESSYALHPHACLGAEDGRRRPDALLKPQGMRRWLTQAANLSGALDSTFRYCFYPPAFAKECTGQRIAGHAQRERLPQSRPCPYALPPPAPSCAFSQQERRTKPSHRPSSLRAHETHCSAGSMTHQSRSFPS
jgi:hypothetical protein